MNKKKSFFKEHKKEIIIGVSLAAVGATCYLIFKNKDALQTGFVNLNKAEGVIKEVAARKDKMTDIDLDATKEVFKTVDVSSHIRHLPEGQHPSAKKLALAIERAIELDENETIVSAYQKNIRKAA